MAARSLDLIINTQTGQLLSGFNSTTQNGNTPSFVFGDLTPITCRLVQPSGSAERPWADIDLTNQEVHVAIGTPGSYPTAGTFTLTYGANTTTALAFDASAATVSAALNLLASIISAGGVSVTSAAGGSYRIVFTAVGVRTAITTNSTALYPTSTSFIAVAQTGSASVQEVVVIRMETQPAAYVELTDDLPVAAAAVTTVRAGSVGVSEIQKLTFDPIPYDGVYTLAYDGEETTDLAWDSTAEEIQAALIALTDVDTTGISVTGSFPTFTITFLSTYANVSLLTVAADSLIVPTGKKGSISLNTTGVVEILSGATRADVTIEVQVVDTVTGDTWTTLQSPAILREDIISNSPASQTAGPVYILESVAEARYVRYDAAQTLTAPNKLQAVTNLGFTTAKATPVDADKVAILDSAASDAPKHSTLTAIWTWIQSKFAGASSKTTPIDADSFNIVDSADSNAAKRVTGTNLKAFLKTYLDTLYVALTGNQTVAGNKTFSGDLSVSSDLLTGSTTKIYRGGSRFYHETGSASMFLGTNSGSLTTTGTSNFAVGTNTLSIVSTGSRNVALGQYAGGTITTGSRNMLIGDATGYPIQVGSDNIGIGYNSLRNITDSAGFTQNIGIGSNTLGNDTGSGNTSIGGESGVSITSGTNNTIIGYFAGRSSLATATNSTAIGYKSNFSASNTIALGGTGVDAAKVTIGGTSAAEALDVTGSAKVSGTLTVGGTNTWNGSTIAGAQAFSSTTRPTSSGTGTPASNSLITASDKLSDDFYGIGKIYSPIYQSRNSANSGAGSSVTQSSGLRVNAGTTNAGYAHQTISYEPIGGAYYIRYDRRCGVSVNLQYFKTTVSDPLGVVRLFYGWGYTYPNADSNALTAKGFGMEITSNGTNHVFRVFAHDGSTFSASSWVSFGDGNASLYNRMVSVETDGSGNITGYISQENGAASFYTATLSTSLSGTASGANAAVALVAVNNASGSPTGFITQISDAKIMQF
jgi:hypothetical protein